MKIRNISLAGIVMAVVLLSGISIKRADAQLGDNDSSINFLAMQIGASAGISSDNYLDYAERLAKTMQYLDPDQQATVFGFVPRPVGGAGTASGSASAISGSGNSNASTSGTNENGATEGGAAESNWWDDLVAAVKEYLMSAENG